MSACPILLLHGLGVDHRMWSRQCGALQEQGQVLCPDLPGFGQEPPLAPERCTPAGYAAWVAEWLAQRAAGPVAVAGYSMGGTLALLLALDHPRRVSRLALCCSSPSWGRGLRGPLATLFAGLGGRLAMEVFQASVAWGCARQLADPAERREAAAMVRAAHRPTMRRLYLGLAGLDLTPRLGELAQPALVVGGSRDLLAPPSHLRALADALPRARLELVAGAGHLLCLSHSDRLTELLSREVSGD